MDIFDRIERNPGPLGEFADYAEGEYAFPVLEGEISTKMKFKGKEMLIFSLNNYLGLANHPEIRKIDAETGKKYGLAYPMGSRAMTAQTKYHIQLEKELAEFSQKESSLLLNFGYQGMFSMLDTLLCRNDVIIYDSESHACAIDGIRLHRGKHYAFEHNNIESLEKVLKKAQKHTEITGGGILVLTEGVFSMNGEQGKIKEIVALKKNYKFRLLVDDAHGFGVMGKEGRGIGEEQNVQDEIDLYFSTFTKSFAGFGAFVSGKKSVIQYIKYNIRSQIFAKALPLVMVIGLLKRLEIMKANPYLRTKLWENVKLLQNGLKKIGHNIGKANTCITPVFLEGTTIEATLIVKDLRETYGIFTSIVVYPVIPKGLIMLRIIPTAEHTKTDIERLLYAFEQIQLNITNNKYKTAS
ncbi:aminotransferase class I/II-fold pyridoxal phosphate-dependent enzyme [Cloacibacterium sp.]|uniref:aminotransferase class I/II-fold pyridoxal phosphate-dependent enzyme n=1 Tax=Cloacibacterium sp. TaxID=1913682 RepID=UPI0039E2A7DD